MQGDFSREQVSEFSNWANAQRMTYIAELNKNYSIMKTSDVAMMPIGTQYTRDVCWENIRDAFICTKITAVLSSTW